MSLARPTEVEIPESDVRKVRLFRTNLNQAVFTPVDLEIPAECALLRKEGDRLIIGPSATPA